jgi:threonine 3-dehydrogenase
MSNVIASDISEPSGKFEGKFYQLDVTDKDSYNKIVKENKITQIVHLASLLSAACEKNLDLAMKVNIGGMHNALNVAKENNAAIFIPSTIASFGPNLEKIPVPDDVIQDPITFYGIGKIYQEKLGSYFFRKFGTDFRCLRYPAIISPYEYAGNGSASYPTEMVHAALKGNVYNMYLEPDTTLPYMYINDCVRGTIELMEAANSNLTRRVYNFQGLSFSPQKYIKELKKVIPIEVKYEIEPLRNNITKTWPVALNDSIARKDWGWNPKIDTTKKLIETMVMDIVSTQQK